MTAKQIPASLASSSPASLNASIGGWRRLRQAGWPIVSGVMGFSALLGIWLALAPVLRPGYLPKPDQVALAFADLIRKGILPSYVLASVRHLLVASLVAIGIGVPLAVAMAMNRATAAFFFPLLNFFQALGGIVWLPLFIVWFGFSENTIFATVLYTVIFPVTFNTLVGIQSIPRFYLNAVRTLGASQLQLVRDVILPGALPNIIIGIRLGFAYGWRALVAAEIVVGANGIGFMIFDAQTFGNLSRLVLGMIVIGFLWLWMDSLILRPIEAATIRRWNLVRG